MLLGLNINLKNLFAGICSLLIILTACVKSPMILFIHLLPLMPVIQSLVTIESL